MKLIEFLQRVSPYQKGEIAGFDDVDADRMIAAKQAREVQKKPSKKSEPKKPGDSKTEGTTGAGGGSDGGDGVGEGGASPDGNGEVKE